MIAAKYAVYFAAAMVGAYFLLRSIRRETAAGHQDIDDVPVLIAEAAEPEFTNEQRRASVLRLIPELER